MKRIFIVLILMFTQHVNADAVREIEERDVFSKVLNEQLSLFIQLPLYYHKNADYAYPVLMECVDCLWNVSVRLFNVCIVCEVCLLPLQCLQCLW